MKLVRFLSLLVLGFVYQSFYSQEVIIYSDMPIVDTDFENVQERKEYEFDPDINYTRSGGGYILESNGLYGLANYYKEIFIPTTYDNIYFQNNVFVLEKEGKIEVRRAFGDAKTFAGILLPSGIWDVISVNQHSALLREDSNEIIYFSFKEQKKILSSVEYALVEPDFMMLKINGKYGV